jgi:superoxide reductase
MVERNSVYKCNTCGVIVQVLHGGDGNLHCCDKPMQLITENTVDAAKEKHVPVIEKIEGGYRVKVGAVMHPMIDTHYIEWIELIADGVSYRQFFKPGEEPIATFLIKAKTVQAREYCNLHGLWSIKL